MAGQVNPAIKAHVFLIRANLSAKKQSLIVSAAMSRYEFEPLRDATLTAIPRAGALSGSVPLSRKHPGACSAQVVHEHFPEANEAPDDELEAEHQEAVALMTIAKQCRVEVDRARQFFRKPQSSEDRKARSDKLKRGLPCVRCGQLGHWKDDNECPAKVKKVVNWEDTDEQATEDPQIKTFVTRERTVCNHKRRNRYRVCPHSGWNLVGLRILKSS